MEAAGTVKFARRCSALIDVSLTPAAVPILEDSWIFANPSGRLNDVVHHG